MDFAGSAASRTAAGLHAAVSEIGCDQAALEAVIHVETSGSGFDKSKRPKMLFEPHVFYAQIKADKLKLQKAIALGVAYPVWGTKPYPADSYPHLQLAIAIDEEAALRSASWGLPQILGTNFKAAGFADAKTMVMRFVDGGEDAQLAAMATFIVAEKLAKNLAAHQWAAFASGYNGKGYKRNAYDTKLKQAYALALAHPDILAAAADVSVPLAADLNAQIARKAKAKSKLTTTAAIGAAALAASTPKIHAAIPHHGHLLAVAFAICIVAAIAAVLVAVNASQKSKTFNGASK